VPLRNSQQVYGVNGARSRGDPDQLSRGGFQGEQAVVVGRGHQNQYGLMANINLRF